MVKAAALITIFLVLLIQRHGASGCFTSIFSFGDSLADTGNFRQAECSKHHFDNHPYGDTYFGQPTGRCSDGRLVIDFVAQAFGLPLLPAYLGVKNEQDLIQGVNFAVVGATALDASFFEERDIEIMTNLSLGVQLQWFKQLLPSLCTSPSSCQKLFKNSLFMVGEIGGNDINYPFFQRKSLQEIHSIIPRVIDMISSAINLLIEEGAVTLMVPGNFPIGCSSSYLTLYESNNMDEYDPSTSCLNWLNEYSKYHNYLLQNELNRLRARHPHTTIIYADYYNVALELYKIPSPSGLTGGLRACCGGGGLYNYNISAACGNNGFTTCDNPLSYVGWDGLHLTEAAYKWVANGILNGPFTVPQIKFSCLSNI